MPEPVPVDTPGPDKPAAASTGDALAPIQNVEPTVAPAPQATSTQPTAPTPAPYEPRAHQSPEPTAKRRVLAEDLTWNLSPVKKLSDLCINVLVARFEEHPILSRVPKKYRERLLSDISVALPLRITAPLVPDEDYWQRRSLVTFKLCNVRTHGGSWKRLFFESHVQKLLEEYVPPAAGHDIVGTADREEMDRDLWAQLELAAPYVFTVVTRQLRPAGYDAGRKVGKEPVPSSNNLNSRGSRTVCENGVRHDHLNLGLVFAKLKNLEELNVRYSVRDCGIDFEWEYFGMTLNDTVRLTDSLKASRVLKRLTVAASGIDDDRCHLIANALRDNRTLEQLDLSHNLISDAGAHALATALASPTTTLSHLTLSSNRIGQPGATFLATALASNAKLTHLRLRMNHLSDRGGLSLFTALRENTTLQALDVSCNQMSTLTVDALCKALKANGKALVELDLSCNKLGTADVAKDLQRSTTLEAGKANVVQPKVGPPDDGKEAAEDVAGKAIFDAVSQNKVK
ncbi:T-complex-associated testis-expressed protein 1 [Geranomyces variabilis]|uniref:T-complex-associated testis-expressed protein 1 n=1 Tax=Geranomyces variabilis TaxID=109894 RepID=A0AAD5XRM5_9FUNG|nr:T-complex-associated testis-expressed protein 1 [Geranomyces variabilis]